MNPLTPRQVSFACTRTALMKAAEQGEGDVVPPVLDLRASPQSQNTP